MKKEEWLMIILGGIAIFAVSYGGYWIAKHGSYWWWYEDLVKETIKEVVKAEALL